MGLDPDEELSLEAVGIGVAAEIEDEAKEVEGKREVLGSSVVKAIEVEGRMTDEDVSATELVGTITAEVVG